MPGPRQVVDPPAFTPLPFGLLSVVQRPSPSGPHWQNGVTYVTNCQNSGGTTFDECIAVTGTGDVAEPSLKDVTTDIEFRGATPFTVFTRFDCSPIGVDDARKVATDALEQTTPWQVERAFWTGLVDGVEVAFPHLAADAEVTDPQQPDIVLQSAATPLVTGGEDIVCALGVLEQELANCYNGVGVIHVSRKVLPTLQAHNQVEVRGDQLFTKNGNLVAVGSGYPGTGPAGEIPDGGVCQEWIFATGAVFMYHSAVRVMQPSEAIDRAENTIEMIAERTYVLGWDCCHLAALVDLGVSVT